MENNEQAPPRNGMEVVDNAGHLIGTVAQVEPNYLW